MRTTSQTESEPIRLASYQGGLGEVVGTDPITNGLEVLTVRPSCTGAVTSSTWTSGDGARRERTT